MEDTILYAYTIILKYFSSGKIKLKFISMPQNIIRHKPCLLILQLFYKAAYNKMDYNNMNSQWCGRIHFSSLELWLAWYMDWTSLRESWFHI